MAGFPVTQGAFDVNTQVTTLLFAGVKEKVLLFVPTLLPFTFHWYEGDVPPLVGVAVKMTEVPVQTGLADGATTTLTGGVEAQVPVI